MWFIFVVSEGGVESIDETRIIAQLSYYHKMKNDSSMQHSQK
jgi:hypothetical protein